MFQLIYLSFTQPRADATVFGVMTTQMKAMLANQQASPEWAFRQTLRTTLAQNHYRARPMTPEMVDEMDLQKSFAFYKDRFADASDFTFVFAGSFDLAAIKPLVEQYLGSLPSLRRQRNLEERRHHAAEGRRGEDGQEGHRAEEPGGHRLHRADRVRLPAPGRARRARPSSSKRGCGRRLREALSGTYGVQVDANASKIPEPRYSITIDFGCDPERTEELVKALFREIETLKAKGPTEKEVERCAGGAPARSTRATWPRTTTSSSEIAERYELSEDVEEFFDLPAEYRKLTAAAVQDAARRYLDTGNYVRVTLFPEKAATNR